MSPTPLNRREAVTLLAAGFALAVQPVTADTITTDADGLLAGEVRVPTRDGEMPAYRARPAPAPDRGPLPTVLVVQEIFGVHEHIKDVCRRLAKAGYLAVAPELFARQGDVAGMRDIDEILAKVVSKVSDGQVMADLDAAAAWAAKDGGGDPKKLAITGFCWGGRITWLYAAHNPALAAGVAWYGRLDGPRDDARPKQPVDLAADLEAPVLGLYGGADRGIPVEVVETMRGKLKDAGKPSEIVLYPDAPHGFYADYRPSFRREAAEDGWKRLLAWFRTHGVT